LTDPQWDEVSVVKQGADPDARIVLIKSHKPEETADMSAPTLSTKLAKALEGVEGGAEALSDEMIEALNAAVEAETEEEEAPTAESTEEAPKAEEKSEEDETPAEEPSPPAAELPAAEAAPAPEPVEVGKTAEFVEVEKRLRAAEEKLATAERDAEIRTLTDEVSKSASGVAVEASELAQIVYRIRKGFSTPEDADKVVELIGTASAAVAEAGAFTESGSALGEDDSDPLGKIVSKMLADAEAAGAPITRPAAVSKALETEAGRAAYAEKRARE
jgi:hypothetical protein